MPTDAPSRSMLDRMVDATPPGRDRYVDLLRAVSITVVVLWHWVGSVTHWTASGRLSMPNPIEELPAGWAATWVLQVIPVFFVVGGYANFVSLRSAQTAGRTAGQFVRSRMERLLRPVVPLAMTWVALDVAGRALVPGYTGVFHWGVVVFVPLWFLGVYAGVVALAPLTAALHERAPRSTIVALAAAIALVDVSRFRLDAPAVGYLNGGLVFVFAHQLGYWYADGTFTTWSRRRLLGLTTGALTGLAVLTSWGPYPASMVATPGARLSNLNPPTAAIACLAVFQIGVALLLRPAANRWLARRGPWRAVIAANSVIMTVFLWHMTAYVAAVAVVEALGGELGNEATARWWLQRPVWLVLPGLVLIPMVRTFRTWERPRPAPLSLAQAQEVDCGVDGGHTEHLQTHVDLGGRARHDRS